MRRFVLNPEDDFLFGKNPYIPEDHDDDEDESSNRNYEHYEDYTDN